jgi:hypothetical protein
MQTDHMKESVECCCSCAFFTVLLLVWLAWGMWPDPTYIAVIENRKGVEELHEQLSLLQNQIKMVHELLKAYKTQTEAAV